MKMARWCNVRYDKQKVKESITPEDVFNLLTFFGGEPEENGNAIISKTICHGGDSRKLYYYTDTGLFHCYTHCNDTFDIFGLIQKVENFDNLNQAIQFAVNFFNLQNIIFDLEDSTRFKEDWEIFKRYDKTQVESKNQNKIILPEFDISILNYYPKLLIHDWQKQNISKEVCDYMGICIDPIGGNILIPHRDIDNRCVGIRQRTLIKELEKSRKYKPWWDGKTLYNHPLMMNLYGIENAAQRIQDMQTAIVVESEKSVLQFQSYFGTANNICVAVCGSSISNYQFNILKNLGIQEMVVAFDRDFENNDYEKIQEVQEKIAKVAKKFSPYATVSVVFDNENLLGYKDSPLDKGKDIFNHLFSNRIVLK